MGHNKPGFFLHEVAIKEEMSYGTHVVFVRLENYPDDDRVMEQLLGREIGCDMSEMYSALLYVKEFDNETEARAYRDMLSKPEYEDYIYADYYANGQFVLD